MGYGGSIKEAGKAIGKSGDEVIDGTIKEDKLGLELFTFKPNVGDQAMLLDDLNFTNLLVHWLDKVQKKESSSRHRISQKMP